MSESSVDRRDFLKSAAAGASAVALAAATYDRVLGANERIGVGFVGVGGRCQAHLDIINKMNKEGKGVAPVAVCDVWDGHEGKYTIVRDGKEIERTYAQGLYPSAKKVGLNVDDKDHVVKDYRKLLDLKEVDVVCVATPDHWHAKICIDAAAAKQRRLLRKAHDQDHRRGPRRRRCHGQAQPRHDCRRAVDGRPTWLMAHEAIAKGTIGHVAQAQTSYYRNSLVGQWRYYRLWKEMNPSTIDWKMFLGHDFEVTKGVPLGPKMPFDRAVFGQWRCYWPFGGGMFTDLFVHQTTHMITAMGVRYPGRVVGGGGLYLEYDERDVPDVATIVADYNEGCQLLITATMISAYPIEEVIRGRLGTIKFVKGGFQVIKDDPNKGAGIPARLEKSLARASSSIAIRPKAATSTPRPLWANFLAVRPEPQAGTLSTPELGAAAFTTVALGVQSYRTGKVLFWDKEARKPVEADASWAKRLEARSKSTASRSR